jgi:Kef-type K+ transport system membrane component KefB
MLLTARFHGSEGGAATLAAIGFVAWTAYAVADIGRALSLPRMTGYILAGVAFGPSAGGIISSSSARGTALDALAQASLPARSSS